MVAVSWLRRAQLIVPAPIVIACFCEGVVGVKSTNAYSFSVSTFYYSSEYPEWVCSPFNDFFLALLDSSFVPNANQSPNPADK
jgi:hypothetical protein